MVKSTEVSYAKVLNCATRVMSDSPGLVDFAIRLVNSVLNLLHRQLKFLGEFK